MADDLQIWFELLTIEDAVLQSTVPAVLVSDRDNVINNDVIDNEEELRHDLFSTNQMQRSMIPDKAVSPDVLSSHPPQSNSLTTCTLRLPPKDGSDHKHGESELLSVEEDVKIQLKEEGADEGLRQVTGNHLEREQVC